VCSRNVVGRDNVVELHRHSEGSNGAFASCPDSWYCIGSVRDLERGPVSFSLPDNRLFAAFRTSTGQSAVLAGRCSHLGADLSRGKVSGENLCCPLHGWEYDADGVCARIPAATTIPPFARQTKFPTEERNGYVFFFNRTEARFPLPCFEGLTWDNLFAARAFEFTVEAPWYLLSANGFDVQHFRCAHDRVLLAEPVVDSPTPFSWRLQADFEVGGHSIYDRLTRCFSGLRVKMTVTSWCGNLVLVSAKFRRTTSYGLVSFIPLGDNSTLIRDIVLVQRSRTALGRHLLDPVDAWLRRLFIREFVRSDVERSVGIRYDPRRMIEADKVLVDYLAWLKNIQH
jgi:3-ketosteroid 9alpha-monooxygenase subunit A